MSASTVRITDELYQELRQIKLLLEQEYFSAAPSIQDFVTVAIKRLITHLDNPDMKIIILNELLEQRQKARSLMGRQSKNND